MTSLAHRDLHITVAIAPAPVFLWNVKERTRQLAEGLISKYLSKMPHLQGCDGEVTAMLAPVLQAAKQALLYGDKVTLVSIDLFFLLCETKGSHTSYLRDLLTACDQGALTIYPFTAQDPDEMTYEYLDVAERATADKSTFPYIRSESQEVYNQFVNILSRITNGPSNVQDISGPCVGDAETDSAQHQGRRKALASHVSHIPLVSYFLDQLPVLDDASVEEVLAVKDKLQRPLVKFRSAVVEYADKITSQPDDEAFALECENFFLRDVSPSLMEIDDQVRSNKYITSLLRRLNKPLDLARNSALGLAISCLFPEYLRHSLGIGVAGIAMGYDACNEWQKERKAIESNRLFFLYQVGNKLQRKHR